MKSDYVDMIRELIEIVKLQQDQIDNLQKQIDIMLCRTQEELNKIVGDRVAMAKNRVREEPSPNLNVLHKTALGDNWEA